MDTKQWKYTIGTGKTPVFLSLGMVLLFGALSVWLHKTQNGARLICDIFTLIMVAVLAACVYRLFFYRVLIGRDGFYYQTGINNGRYYSYGELRKAWISAGRNLSGHQSQYCCFETIDGKVTRFAVYHTDKKSVNYLVKRTEAETAGRNTETEERMHQYRIDGRSGGAAGLAGAFMAAFLICIFEIPLLRLGGIALVMGILGLILAGAVLLVSLFSYFCFQVKIEENGFYCQTNPFNGAYYRYGDITRSWVVKRVYRYRRSANRNHYFYLYFSDRFGNTRRFQFAEDIHGYEVNILKKRIERYHDGKEIVQVQSQ